MTPEEKKALVQFMGTIYGESKKNDQMLVGQSVNLQPKSDEVKRQVEAVLRAPETSGAQRPQQPVQQSLPPVAAPVMITPEQAQQELAQQGISKALVPNVDNTGLEEVAIQAQVVDPNQMEFDLSEPSKVDKIIELLEKQNKILLEIRDNSVKSKYNAKRAKNTKPQ